MHPSIEKSAKKKTIAFSIVFPLTPHFRHFSVFQRVLRLYWEVIVFRLPVFLAFTTLRGYENAPQLCIKIGVRIWRRKRDLNPRAGFPTYSLSRGAPSPLGYFSNGSVVSSQGCWRRGWDSNPRSLAGSLVFKTSSLNHSDTSPYVFYFVALSQATHLYYHFFLHMSTTFFNFFYFFDLLFQ